MPTHKRRFLVLAIATCALFAGCVAESASLEDDVGEPLRRSSACKVTPNPVVVGASYTLAGSGLRTSWDLRAVIVDSVGTTVLDVAADSEGRFSRTLTAQHVGVGEVAVQRLRRTTWATVAECGFTVIASCTPRTCAAGECGTVSNGCGGSMNCGECPAACGDHMCNGSETCSTCPGDCGVCPAVCGDHACNGSETCSTCPGDCGACGGMCGDSICTVSTGELCTTCADCDTTAVVCGNGQCQTGETSASCTPDCGPSPWPSDWLSFEQQALVLINQYRAAGTDCPSGPKSPVSSLSTDANLQRASELHSWDMAYSGYMDHTSCNGRSPWSRAAAQGTSADGETIGAGQSTPASIVNGWMSSTSGHCDILMSGGNSAVGVGYANSSGRHRWTALFR